jgi:hypothetical protein
MTPFENTTRRAVPVIATAAVLLFAASGCGESKADKQAAAYADSLCTSISGWEQQVTAVAVRLDAGSPQAVARTKLDEAATATVGLVATIHKIEVPDVDGADRAKQSVDTFVVDSMSTVDAVKAGRRQLDTYGTGTANVATVVLPLGLRLQQLVREGKTTVSDVEAIKGPFEHAVKKSDACQALKSSQDDQA